MTLWQFIDKWIGKKLDWDNAWAGQCVDLFRYYCNEVLEIDQPAGVWGAANFWSDFESDPVLVANFTKVENNADFTPLEGDVMVWNFNAGGGFGHIAMCTGENTGTQYFKSFDQNWSRVSYCEIVNHSYKNVYGVLRPKQNMKITQEEFDKIRLERDRNWNLYQDEIKKTTGLKEEIERLKAENSESYAQAELRKKEISTFIETLAQKLFLPAASDKTDIISGVERLLVVEDQLTAANKIIAKKDADFAKKENEWSAEINELKTTIGKMSLRLENLEQEIESGKTEKADNEWFKSVINRILSIFNKEK